MRVLIDATPLLVRSAGVKNYLYYWITWLRRAAGSGSDVIQTFPALDLRNTLNHEIPMDSLWRTIKALGSLAAANYMGLNRFGHAARSADLFHASSLVQCPPAGPRLTTTIHDLTSWILPQFHSNANRRTDRNLAELIKKADGIIAVSESTRDDAVRILGLPESKIHVIHSGIADAFFNVTESQIAAVREKYKLARKFVLSVGTIEPRKNIDGLLDAFRALPGTLRDEYEMVFAGPMGWADRATEQRVRHLRYLGYVPELDIAPLTAAADVLACPSFYEGFGFPVAQAMAAGVPVLTSNISSLPEITGDAAILVDPKSQSEIRDGLSRLLLSPDLRHRLASRGRERAERFRWETCAAKSLEFFRSVAG